MKGFVLKGKKRIAELEELIREHRRLYYNEQPEIPDETFDAYVDELTELDSQNTALREVGAPVAPDVTGLPSKQHRIPMGSLDKVPEDRLDFWCNKVGAPFLVQEKYDGISMELEYEKGVLVDAITRGDGFTGEVVTHNAIHFKNVRRKLPIPFSGSVRGEVICRLSVFEKYFVDEGFANPRNTVSGTVRKKHGDLTLNRHFEIFIYDVVGEETEFETEKEKVKFIRKNLKLATGECFFDQDVDGIRKIFKEYAGDSESEETGKRQALDYDIDGLVIRADSLARQRELGEVGNRPRYMAAYKFVSEGKETILKNVEWSLGLAGRVTPVARLEPVEVSGVTVSNATLHNFDNIRSLDLRLGDLVLVERKGDVIPQVVKVLESRDGEIPKTPEVCPTCEASLEVDSKYLRCPNPECPGKLYGDIRKWIVELEIDSIGEKWIQILMDEKLLADVADLYKLTVENLLPLERMGEILADKMIRNISESKTPPLDVFIAALNIPEFSRQRAQMLIEGGHTTLENIWALKPADIAAEKGFAEILAEKVYEGLHDREERIDNLREVGVVAQDAELVEKTARDGILEGKTFCFTGAVKSQNPDSGKRWTRKQLEELVRQHGGKPLSVVTSGLNYLVMADPESKSSKAVKARKIGTQVISEEEFFKLVFRD